MPKKRSETVAAPPSTGDERVSIILYKGSRAYRDWLRAASRSERMPATGVLDVALAEWASRNGLPEPPER